MSDEDVKSLGIFLSSYLKAEVGDLKKNQQAIEQLLNTFDT